MKRIIRLTESDLTRIVRRVISEQTKEIKVGSEYEFDGITIGSGKEGITRCKVTKIYPNDAFWIIYATQLDGQKGCLFTGGNVIKKDGTKERYMALSKSNLDLAADFVLRETDNPPTVKLIGGGYGSNMITWL